MSMKNEQTHSRHTIIMVIEFVRLVLQLQIQSGMVCIQTTYTHTDL